MDKDVVSAVLNHAQIFNAIGFFADVIVVIWVACLLYSTPILFVVFLLSVMANTLLNKTLKHWIHQKRPNDPLRFLASERFAGKAAYGMPSGHSQLTFFTMTFYSLVSHPPSTSVVLSLLFISLLSCYERWAFRNHTITQLVGGAIVGVILALLVSFVIKKEVSKPSGQITTQAFHSRRSVSVVC